MNNMADLKRTYTIPLRRGFNNTQEYRRAKRAVSLVKQFLTKHMKSDNVKIGPQLNLKLWERGIKNPPHKVTVDVTKDKEGVVRAELEGVAYKDTVSVEPSKDVKEQIAKAASQAAAKKAESKKADAKDAEAQKPAAKAETTPAESETKKQSAKVEEKTEEEAPAKADKKAE